MSFVVNYPPVTKVTVDETTNEVVVAAAGPRGPQGETGVVAATAPLTYDSGTQTVALDESGIEIAQSQVTDLTTDLAAKLDVAGGRILQVVSSTKTDTLTTTSGTLVDVTGLSVSITPSTASSKMLILVNVSSSTGSAGGSANYFQIVRDSTHIARGDAEGSRTRCTFAAGANVPFSENPNRVIVSGMTFVDSPNTTSATTYKLQVRARVSGNIVHINRAQSDVDSADRPRTISNITVMEISA